MQNFEEQVVLVLEIMRRGRECRLNLSKDCTGFTAHTKTASVVHG